MMNRFNKILFVADGTAGEKVALTKTVQLARDIDASVSVIDVVETAENFAITDVAINMVVLQRELLKARNKELEKLVKSAKPKSLKIEIPVLLKEGKDFIEIIKTVKNDGFDLVVKASGKPHVTGMLFSTLDLNLVRKCPCPVLVLKPRKKISHSKILAAVDLRIKTKTKKNLDRTVIELASSLASLEKGTLHILHAWHLSFEKRLSNRKGVQAAYKSMKTMLRDMRKTEKAHLDEMAAEFALTKSSTHLIKGEPANVIPRFVKSARIDLVVMGSVGRTGIQGFFIGNTAEKILDNINCSVLAIKPPGWKSPVR